MRCAASTTRQRTLTTLVAAVTLFGIVWSAGCEDEMADQPRYDPLEISTFYPDLRASRHPVDGTVARGQLERNRYTLEFVQTTNALNESGYPFEMTAAELNRGQLKYDIYCAVCHGIVGGGDGIVPSRGYTPPPSFHIERLRQAPPSHVVAAIENGFGRMPNYAEMIEPKDRWMVAAYIEALQLSQYAPADAMDSVELRELEGGDGG